MQVSSPLRRYAGLAARSFAFASVLGPLPVMAQGPQARISAPIVDQDRVTIAGSRQPRALVSADIGAVPASTELHGITLNFRRSEAQQAALEALIAAQQDPTSAQYHQWLTPEQFAAQFGMAQSDLLKVENWLQSQGFSIDSVARGNDRIQFSGTEAQVASAFGSPLHYYKLDGQTHFAPSTDLTIPAALASTVQGIRNLSDFRPAPQVRFNKSQTTPQFTSSQSGSHFLTPKDIATIYDVTPAYNAGYTGVNQSIAVVGQSTVFPADIANFQAAAGITPKAPTLVLVPGSGSPVVSTGDEAESDLDLEYTSGLAPAANIFFVYTGSNSNSGGAFGALSYAISEHIAPIISVSYAACEALLSASDYTTLNGIMAQAAVQGQTVISATSDAGSTACSGETGLTLAQQETVSTSYPGSSQYVTGIGGTEFPAAAVAGTNNTYFSAASGTDVIGSALSYIPEQVWNDDSSTTGLAAGGGGTSIFTPRPTWQAGVPGIPAGTFRLVPDISLTSSPVNAAYLFCSSDSTATGVTGSCSHGFRDVNNQSLTAAGGTSFAAPALAGMLALINQARNSTGQGVINPTLYTLASVPATYASAFHDITTGTNACTAGVTLCSAAGASVYAAGVGYDEASGLGSVDLFKLLSAWPTTSVSALPSTTTTLTPATVIPVASATDAITITIAPVAISAVLPTGTVSLTVDGTVVNGSLALASGVAGYTFTSAVSGSHVIVATYSGDKNYAGSTGTTLVTVGGTTGTFTVAAPALSVANGSSGSSTVTVTPVNGYTGTVNWTLSTQSIINNACYSINSVTVSGTTAVSTTLTIAAGASQCAATVFVKGKGQTTGAFGRMTATNTVPGKSPFGVPAAFAFAGLLAIGFAGRRSRPTRALVALALTALLGLGLSGCGDNSFNTAAANAMATTGSFQITLTGTDSNNSANTSSTTFTLTIH